MRQCQRPHQRLIIARHRAAHCDGERASVEPSEAKSAEQKRERGKARFTFKITIASLPRSQRLRLKPAAAAAATAREAVALGKKEEERLLHCQSLDRNSGGGSSSNLICFSLCSRLTPLHSLQPSPSTAVLTHTLSLTRCSPRQPSCLGSVLLGFCHDLSPFAHSPLSLPSCCRPTWRTCLRRSTLRVSEASVADAVVVVVVVAAAQSAAAAAATTVARREQPLPSHDAVMSSLA